MIHTIEAETITNFLKSCPKIPLTENSMFRLVWSDDERELRHATYTKFDAHGNSIGEETKLENSPKYSWIQSRWILEQWFPPQSCFNPELPNSVSGSFEPIYVFETTNKERKLLPLRLDVVQFIIKHALKAQVSEMLRKSISLENKENKEKKIEEQDMDLLNDEGPLVSQFHDGTAIIMPGKSI